MKAARWSIPALALVVSLFGLAGLASADPLSLPLTVQEPGTGARVAEPVSGGIPLPAGQYKKDQPFALFDGAKEVPVQILPLVVDEKGFVRWILVDLQADLAATAAKTFTLKDVKATAAPATPLKTRDAADAVTLDTGKATLVISKTKPFTLFDAVSVGGKPVVSGGEVSYTDATATDGTEKRYVAAKPTSVVVEYAGPLRTTVCVRGGFVGDEQNKLTYVAWVTAWAGHSDVHVKYALCNSNEEHYSWRRIKDSTVRLNLAGEPAGTIVGAGKPAEAGGEVWMEQSGRSVTAAAHNEDLLGWAKWYHDTVAGAAKAVAGDKELWASSGKSDLAEGWLAVKVGGGTVCVDDLYFVEDPPRKLAVHKGGLELSGIAPMLDGIKRPFMDKARWLHDCSHLSSQYLIDFQAPATAEMSAQAKAARQRIHVMAPPAWYFQTEALAVGEFGTQADEMAAYDKWGWKYDPSKAPRKAQGIFANMPRWSAGDDNHYTSEQDTTDSLVLMYLRTGDLSFFHAAESWANYFMDLQAFRTDGWRWKDGGVWWTKSGPLGSRPQRATDPVTGMGSTNTRGAVFPYEGSNEIKSPKATYDKNAANDLASLANAKACHCHNWGEGLSEWFLITGERDALDAAIDCVEQNYDTQTRAFGRTPGKPINPSRDFTRACYLTNATRICVPTDPFVIEASDTLANVFLKRPNREPRGFVVAAEKLPIAWTSRIKTFEDWMKQYVGARGLDEMAKAGVTADPKTGELTDPKTGAKWFPLYCPHTWMFPPLSRAMETYYRLTGNKDALDWTIAFGEGAARVLYQTKHGNLAYNGFLVDFPTKGWAWDLHSWALPDDSTDGKGEKINGYLAEFYPDVCARAYAFTGDPICKQRAYDFWNGGSHRGYWNTSQQNVGSVAKWANCVTTHSESICFTGKTFYEFAHPRTDTEAPAAVADLTVSVSGATAKVSFTAPADKGGKVARYQMKCSDKPIVDYDQFLKDWKENKDAAVCNWWMASNLQGEPAPGQPGAKLSFEVSGVPAGTKYFAVRSFDDSDNRSALGMVAEAK